MKATEFLTGKKNTGEPLYLISGSDQYLKKKVMEQLTALIPKNQVSMNLSKFDLENDWLTDAVNDANSMPFLGDRRLVFILHPHFLTGEKVPQKNIQKTEEFEKYLMHPALSTSLVIVLDDQKMDQRKKICKLLKKKALIIECDPLNEKQISHYVVEKLEKKGYTIEKAALELLIQKTEAVFSNVMTEINKLCLTALNTKKISVEMVAGLVPQSLEQNVFELNKLVLQDKKKAAIQTYHDLILQHEEPLKLNALLISQVRLLLQTMILTRHGYSQGDIASLLKVHPYRVKLAVQHDRVISQDSLRKSYLGLLKLEEKLKTTNQDPENLFQLFLTGYFY